MTKTLKLTAATIHKCLASDKYYEEGSKQFLEGITATLCGRLISSISELSSSCMNREEGSASHSMP